MKASISLYDPDVHVVKILAAEVQRLLNDRAHYDCEHSGEETVINFEAQDATALRAVLNSVCKSLIVYEKTKQVVDNDSRATSTN